MKSFIVFASVLAAAVASPQFLNYNYNPYFATARVAAPVAVAPVAPAVTASQYHSQDELGQYSYGYSGGPSAKTETRTADGITRGAYSYIDGHGLVQHVNYVADPVNGFRVAATNLPVGPSAPAPAVRTVAVAQPIAAPAFAPQPAVVRAYSAPVHYAAAGVPLDTPEVHAAKLAHYRAHAEALARSG